MPLAYLTTDDVPQSSMSVTPTLLRQTFWVTVYAVSWT